MVNKILESLGFFIFWIIRILALDLLFQRPNIMKRYPMLGRSKTLFFVAALILIPILLGMTPLSFIQKIGSGCPLAQGKQTLKCNPCPFNCITSQDDLPALSVSSSSLAQEIILSSNSRIGEPIFILSGFLSQAAPLRC